MSIHQKVYLECVKFVLANDDQLSPELRNYMAETLMTGWPRRLSLLPDDLAETVYSSADKLELDPLICGFSISDPEGRARSLLRALLVLREGSVYQYTKLDALKQHLEDCGYGDYNP